MLKQIFLNLCLVVISLSQLQGEILETNEISTVRNYTNPDCIVLFNITGTLYEPSITLADHRWREYFVERVNLIVSDSDTSQKLINRVKSEIVQKIPKKAVEEITPKLISDLQQEKIPVFGITKKKISTAYADNFALITSNHLLSIGIDLEKTLSYCNAIEEKTDNYSFAYGMIFTSKNAVGPALVSFLENNHYSYSHIVMVDDSQKSLESVEAALAPSNITFTGLRYSRTDAHKEKFNPILGIIEFIAFIDENKIISDEEAAQIQLDHPEVNYELCLDDLIRRLSTP